MIIDDILFSRVLAFVRCASRVCQNCPRKSVSTCMHCPCEDSTRIIIELEAVARPKTERILLKKPERILLRFIREKEIAGLALAYCINRIAVPGMLAWEKMRSLKKLVDMSLVIVTEDTKSGHMHKFAETVPENRTRIDEAIK